MLTYKGGYLNIGTMTGREKELEDMMERKNVDILCLQETKWKGSKARNIGGGCKIFYNGADGRKNVIGIVVREELAESVLEMKRVSDRLMAMKLEVNGSILNIVIMLHRLTTAWRRKRIFGKTWMD